MHAHRHLRKRDPRLGEWIDRIGPLQLPTPPVREPYVALLEAIAHQQLAGAAARAIWSRVLKLFEDGTPCSKRMADMTEEQLRSAGLSRAKALAMKDICDRVNAGKIPNTSMIGTMTDAEISAQLLEARGVGAWTVDMLLMFTLCRADVMPVTDYGVRKGFQVLYRKRSLPTPKQLLKFSSVWQPHRSVASLYLWRIAESAKKPKRPKKKTAQRKTAKKRTLQ
jgi:DNA-3-methyladenine glycosylase II